MTPSDKRLAELVLRHLALDTRISGIRFGPPLQVLLDSDSDSARPAGQAYLNLEGPWSLFANASAARWAVQNLTTSKPEDAQLATICSIRGQKIVSATLTEEAPHLLLGLDLGSVLAVNGLDDHYECWQIGNARLAPPRSGPANDLSDASGQGAVVYPADPDCSSSLRASAERSPSGARPGGPTRRAEDGFCVRWPKPLTPRIVFVDEAGPSDRGPAWLLAGAPP